PARPRVRAVLGARQPDDAQDRGPVHEARERLPPARAVPRDAHRPRARVGPGPPPRGVGHVQPASGAITRSPPTISPKPITSNTIPVRTIVPIVTRPVANASAFGAVEIGIMNPNDAPSVAPSTAGIGAAPAA